MLWSWQEEEEMEEVCGAPGQPVARHTLKQNNIVTSVLNHVIPIDYLVSPLSKFISEYTFDYLFNVQYIYIYIFIWRRYRVKPIEIDQIIIIFQLIWRSTTISV